MLKSPLAYSVKVPAFVLRIEIHVCGGLGTVPPHLAEHADVDCAHELLADYVKTVCCYALVSSSRALEAKLKKGEGGKLEKGRRCQLTDVILEDPVIVHERSFSFLMVVVEVEIQRLPKKIQAM